MTPEELREKVIQAVMVVPDAYLGPAAADAAIRVVLEGVQLKECERIIREYSQHPEDLDFADRLRALLPQDKDTGSSAPVANRRD